MAPSKQDKDQAVSNGHKSKDIEGEDNEWKFRAPYKVHDPSEGFKAVHEGSCHCGRVQYQLSRERPVDAKFCHCNTCQVLHGAPFQWAAIFNKDDINFTSGINDLAWYESTEKTTRHKLPCKVSCRYCRSPIMDEGRNMILLFPTLVKFKGTEEKDKFAPSCHIFYSQRVIDVKDGLPKWDGMNEKSELIGETGGQESGAGNDGVKTKEKRKLEMELEEEEMDQRAKKSLRGGREH